MLVDGFSRHGHNVSCVSVAWTDETLDHIDEWRLPNIRDLDKVDAALSLINPDVVICFWHTSGVQDFTSLKYPPGNCLVFYWLPWEGSTLPPDSEDYFKRVESGRMVHLSNFAHELWVNHVQTSEVIPHGVDPKIFSPDYATNPLVQRQLLVSKWREKLNAPIDINDIIILSVDRNIWHKRWDASFDFIKKLQTKTEKRIRFIAHTKKIEKGVKPVDGYDLPALEKTYGLDKGTVIYTNFDWMRGLPRSDMADLYRVADLRISMSQGEGFGIPTIEASMCGCLQIVNNTTTMPELFPEGSPCLAAPAMSESKRGVLYQVPNVNAMVGRAHRLLFKATDKVRSQIVHSNYKHALAHFTSEKMVSAWLKLIDTNSNYPDSNRWYRFRDGYETNHHAERDNYHMAQVLTKFGDDSKVLELGSFTGKFIESCISSGLFVHGIEPDVAAFELSSNKSKLLSRNISFLDEWPETDIIVATDFLTLYPTNKAKEILELAASRGKWIVIRNKPLYRKGKITYDLKWADKFLEGLGSGRRYDLEKVICSRWFKEFSHEIWQTKESWEDVLIPPGFE